MEQAKCLVWVKSKHKDHHHNTPSKTMKKFEYDPYLARKDHNHEEGVGFGDAVAAGGCIWPPRSYACSFCKREFKSAQALGGHMNVHRRDRALLKQVLTHKNHDSLLLPYSTSNHHKQFVINSSKSLLSQSCNNNHPTHVSPLLSKPFLKSSQKACEYVSGRKVIGINANKEIKKACGDQEHLSNKRCKKSGGDCASLLPFFDEGKCSNVKDKGAMMKVNEVLSVGGTKKSMDDKLDLELRLGTLTQKVK